VDGFVVEPYILVDKMKILAKMPLMHEPGEKWTYGLNTDVLGYLVEVLSGMSLNDFFNKQIFVPLGMTDTHFYTDEKDSSRFAAIYSDDGKSLVKMPMEQFNYPFKGSKTYYSGGSGIASNALDYAKFLQMLVNGGSYNGKQLLGRKTIELMTKNQVGNLGSFGLGFAIVNEKGSNEILSSVGNYSWSGFFSTYFWVDPKEDMIFIFLTQKYPNAHWDIEQKFHIMAYQALID
jgi:CubicO group peptidase (beta-lactamase class C family)